jgi:hypothetical protein
MAKQVSIMGRVCATERAELSDPRSRNFPAVPQFYRAVFVIRFCGINLLVLFLLSAGALVFARRNSSSFFVQNSGIPMPSNSA